MHCHAGFYPVLIRISQCAGPGAHSIKFIVICAIINMIFNQLLHNCVKFVGVSTPLIILGRTE